VSKNSGIIKVSTVIEGRTVHYLEIFSKTPQNKWWVVSTFYRTVEKGETSYSLSTFSSYLNRNSENDPSTHKNNCGVILSLDNDEYPLEIRNINSNGQGTLMTYFNLGEDIIEKLKDCNLLAVVSPFNSNEPIFIEPEILGYIKSLL
jgi:hypothetical protein